MKIQTQGRTLVFLIVCFIISDLYAIEMKSKNLKNNLQAQSSESILSETLLSSVSEADKLAIVQLHNSLRNSVATQTSKVGTKLPAAKNMRQVYWSEDIAAKAQEWANGNTFAHSSKTFRTITNIGQVGENLAIQMTSSSTPLKDWAGAIDDWFSEIDNYNTSLPVTSFTSSGHKGTVGHFTQLIWAETYLIGCGYSTYVADGWTNSLYVCQYAKAGNYLRSPIYLPATSKADKQCATGTYAIDADYPGLCCVTGKCSKKDFKY